MRRRATLKHQPHDFGLPGHENLGIGLDLNAVSEFGPAVEGNAGELGFGRKAQEVGPGLPALVALESLYVLEEVIDRAARNHNLNIVSRNMPLVIRTPPGP